MSLLECIRDLGGCCRNVRCGGEYDSDDYYCDDSELKYRDTHVSYKPGYTDSRESGVDYANFAGKNNSKQVRNSRKASIFGKKDKVNSEVSLNGGKRTTQQSHGRQSVAVVECPLPSLMGKSSQEHTSYDPAGNPRDSNMSLNRSGPRMSCVKPVFVDPVRPSVAIPIGNQASVSALEVCPASPEREKLIEIYIITTHSITKAESLPHLSQYFQNVERDSIVIIANEEDNDFTIEDLRKFKHAGMSACMFSEDVQNVERYSHTVSILGVSDGHEYLSEAVAHVNSIRKANQGDGKTAITVGVSRCIAEHNHSLIEDINGINILVSDKLVQEARITKPRGVPVVTLDNKHVAHISIGFDEYDQYEIRRSELVDYYSFLQDTGMSDFMEEEVIEIMGEASKKINN